MSLKNLDNLVKAGQLKIEAFNKLEFIGLVDSGQKRLPANTFPQYALRDIPIPTRLRKRY